jgi:Tol biopolymer transport system component
VLSVTSLSNINVLSNDTDADSNPLTVTIEEAPLIGTAVPNTDGTIRLESLPSGFKGVTRFRYRVTDPGGLSSTATAVVFVGTEPFRAVLAGDASADGSYELYVTDFASAPAVVTTATQGTQRLHSFLSSPNGATIVYRRTSTTTPATSDLSFVRTANPRQDARIPLPAGVSLVADVRPADQYTVSDDGQFIAFIARDAQGADAVYVLNVATPAAVSKVTIANTVRASSPRFASNSQLLYVLASGATSGVNRDLYAVALDSLAVGRVSAPSAAGSADDILQYSVSLDQSRILLQANRAGGVDLYFVDATRLQNEIQVNQNLGRREQIAASTAGLPPGAGGSIRGQRVAYSVQNTLTNDMRVWLADVSATPNPRQLGASGARVLGFRPDDEALLYSSGGNVYEARLDGTVSDQLVGAGADGWYDSTGNIVLLRQSLPSGGSPPTYPALAVAVRGGFGTVRQLGTPVLAARFSDVSGFDRAVVLLAEGAATETAPATARVALVNAMAPDKLLYLSEFSSPLQLASSSAVIVR